ncbi:unnamed protein product [Acanthoscelides obtectus]|uniref:Uncharacterized protein n=1 Tax=Acanthoscelides obtectus TaxID=200917 RepID=A0A9P0LQY8_ACAOB|nr:unnamed protein product [Acanthoscelides obtectus]CAH2015492.1 unnamed protein product [Acanthoscelides obtectus]CAK1633365.1 hypothetical protein AOBTE_LOCUS8076 [Acanthoscelides obtectus]CAK1633371.1 hypothetical protein AOBTE_LOCUS8082 [Acanthoscelides obtectus]
MSPANLGVERYIGACLISQQNHHRPTNKPRPSPPQSKTQEFLQDVYSHHQRHPSFRLQRCQSHQEGWAGGMPLISFTNAARRAKRADHDELHGAPLILAKTFNYRNKKVYKNNNATFQQQRPPGTKVFENSNIKKQHPPRNNNSASGPSTDAVSVTSDESSGSNHSETCLPRIIKPRKRRKKDKKPAPLLSRPLSQDGCLSTDSASPDVDKVKTVLFLPFSLDPYTSYRLPVEASQKIIDRLILGDVAETPKLHHDFEDVQEPDINGNQSTVTCQCRYCDPSGQIWDVDRNCYSPFLTPPSNKSFRFPSSSSISTSCLEHSMSSVSLEEGEENTAPPQKPIGTPRDLEVSTEIVTSLNGHRDLEIKFFSSNSNGVNEKSTLSKTSKSVHSVEFLFEE